MLTETVLANIALAPATGSASRNGVALDVRGYAGAAFVVHFGTVAAGSDHSVVLQGSNDGTNWSNLSGWTYAVAAALSDTVAIVDVGRPRHRYLRLAITKDGANASTESAVAYRYHANREPVEYAEPLTVNATKLHAPEAAA